MVRLLLCMGTAALLAGVAVLPAQADYRPRESYSKSPGYVPHTDPRKTKRHHKYDAAEGYVVTESVGRVKQVAAPVRVGPFGYQVKLPGGSWVDCEYSCEYTLRRLTVEFWDGQGNSTFVSPGRFRKDFYLDGSGRYDYR